MVWQTSTKVNQLRHSLPGVAWHTGQPPTAHVLAKSGNCLSCLKSAKNARPKPTMVRPRKTKNHCTAATGSQHHIVASAKARIQGHAGVKLPDTFACRGRGPLCAAGAAHHAMWWGPTGLWSTCRADSPNSAGLTDMRQGRSQSPRSPSYPPQQS